MERDSRGEIFEEKEWLSFDFAVVSHFYYPAHGEATFLSLNAAGSR